MTQLLDLQAMKDRIAACLAFESHREGSSIRMEALTPMHHLFLTARWTAALSRR